MAHIFKHPDKSVKGIVVLTHKEFAFLNDGYRFSRRSLSKPISAINKKIAWLANKRKVATAINKIKKNYFIGVHWGFFSEGIETPSWVSFHMASDGTCSFKGRPFVIPMSSANFTPEVMREKGGGKYWDLICVAKNDNKKKLDVLVRQIRKIYDAGYPYKVLFVIASNLEESAASYYTDIFDDYFSMFSERERDLFTIIKTHPDTGFQGFSYSFLSHLYNQSKVFTIFSQKEGECRVIKEAQLCGLPVVVKSDMQGGGRDYLNDKNALFFDSYDTAFETLIDAVEGFDRFEVNSSEIRKEIGEQESIERLEVWFKELFEMHGQSFDGGLVNTDNLNRRLPAHYFDSSVGWAASPDFRFKTTDIVDYKMLYNFCDHLYL